MTTYGVIAIVVRNHILYQKKHIFIRLVMMEDINNKFSEESVVNEMNNRVKLGLWEYEKKIIKNHFPKDGDILNIGCGCGREAIAIAKLGYRVFATDITKKQLIMAEENAQNENVEISFSETNGIVIPFNKKKFDVIILWTQVLGNIEEELDRIKLLCECSSRLNENGIITSTVHEKLYCQKTWTNLDENWLYPWGKGHLKYKLFTIESYTELLKKVNLNIIEMNIPEDQNAIIYSVSEIRK